MRNGWALVDEREMKRKRRYRKKGKKRGKLTGSGLFRHVHFPSRGKASVQKRRSQ